MSKASSIAIVLSGHEDPRTIARVNDALKLLRTINVELVRAGQPLYGSRYDTVLVDPEWPAPRSPGAWPAQQWYDQVLRNRVKRQDHLMQLWVEGER